MFKRNKKGIKVCRVELDGFKSAFNDGRVVDYKIGKWAKRPEKCGPLAVFDTVENAKGFIDSGFDSKKFFRCKYKPSKETRLYKTYKGGGVSEKEWALPYGTIFADKVKIIKEIIIHE